MQYMDTLKKNNLCIKYTWTLQHVQADLPDKETKQKKKTKTEFYVDFIQLAMSL